MNNNLFPLLMSLIACFGLCLIVSSLNFFSTEDRLIELTYAERLLDTTERHEARLKQLQTEYANECSSDKEPTSLCNNKKNDIADLTKTIEENKKTINDILIRKKN